MGACAVCLIRTGKKSQKSFHNFPFKKNPAVAKQWVDWVCAVKSRCWTPRKTSKICSDHFATSAFDRSAFRVELHVNSVPTIFNSPNNNKTVVAEENATEQKSTPKDGYMNSRLENHSRDNSNELPTFAEIPASTALNSVSTQTEAIPGYDAMPNVSAPAAADQCRTGRLSSLLIHDHNYEDTPTTYRIKLIKLKENLRKVRSINKSQKQSIKKLKKKIESLEDSLHLLRQDLANACRKK